MDTTDEFSNFYLLYNLYLPYTLHLPDHPNYLTTFTYPTPFNYLIISTYLNYRYVISQIFRKYVLIGIKIILENPNKPDEGIFMVLFYCFHFNKYFLILYINVFILSNIYLGAAKRIGYS